MICDNVSSGCTRCMPYGPDRRQMDYPDLAQGQITVISGVFRYNWPLCGDCLRHNQAGHSAKSEHIWLKLTMSLWYLLCSSTRKRSDSRLSLRLNHRCHPHDLPGRVSTACHSKSILAHSVVAANRHAKLPIDNRHCCGQRRTLQLCCHVINKLGNWRAHRI